MTAALTPSRAVAPERALTELEGVLARLEWNLLDFSRTSLARGSGLAGSPGSVRRTRAGSVTIVFSFFRTTGSGSVIRIVFP